MQTAAVRVLGIALATSALSSTAPALAQGTHQTGPAIQQTASAPDATMQQADSAIGDIIVTARRRAERAQDIPVALSVATGEMLERRSVTSFIEVQRQTPSLHIFASALSATATNLSMRGQQLADIRLNIDPAVAIYIDGVYLPRAQGSNAADLLDIDRVEVLAGPQGTLYGKNTTGGAVSLYTKDPTNEREGFIKSRVATHGEFNLAAMLNFPLAQGVGLRLVASVTERDGYGTNSFNGDNNGQLSSRYVRGTLKLEPTDALTVTLRGDYTKAKVTREAYKGFSELVPPNTTTGLGPLATVEAALELNGYASFAAFQAAPLATRNAQLAAADTILRSYSGGNPDDGTTDQSVGENVEVWGGSAVINYRFNDSLSLKSITALRGFTRNATADLDGTPFAILQYPYQRTHDRQFSEESQLNLTALDNRLNGILGVYYSDEQGHERIDQTSVRVISGATATGTSEADVNNKSFGVFAQTSFKLTPQLSATGGLRYSKDDRRLRSTNRNAVNCTALGVSLASIGGVANCVRDSSVSFDAISYTASLEFHPVRDVMIYAKTSRGYRAGGLPEASTGNTPAQADLANTPFRPETVTDYEFGVKSELFDHHLRANIDYYRSTLKDAIRNVTLPVPGSTAVAAGIQNAASAKIDGVEFDITAVPIQGLELSVNGAYTNARFVKYITPTGEDRTGIPLIFTPEWQVGGSAAYTANLGRLSWRNQVDVSYTSNLLAAEIGAYSPAHTVFNARSSVDVSNWDLTIAIYAKNFTNERYLQFPVDVRSSLGFSYAGLYNAPRTFGLEVTKKF